MKNEDIEKRLGKKVNLGGRALGEVLDKADMNLISFWSFMENQATDRKARHRKDHGGQLEPETEKQIDQEIEAEGTRILAQYNGDAGQALASLL